MMRKEMYYYRWGSQSFPLENDQVEVSKEEYDVYIAALPKPVPVVDDVAILKEKVAALDERVKVLEEKPK